MAEFRWPIYIIPESSGLCLIEVFQSYCNQLKCKQAHCQILNLNWARSDILNFLPELQTLSFSPRPTASGKGNRFGEQCRLRLTAGDQKAWCSFDCSAVHVLRGSIRQCRSTSWSLGQLIQDLQALARLHHYLGVPAIACCNDAVLTLPD